jgi:hypothetical protein
MQPGELLTCRDRLVCHSNGNVALTRRSPLKDERDRIIRMRNNGVKDDRQYLMYATHELNS